MEFLRNYQHQKNFRYESFAFALKEAHKRSLKQELQEGKQNFSFLLRKIGKMG